MKEWAYTLILCSLLTLLARVLLPKGEHSPLFGTVKFLISLVLVIATLSPLAGLVFSESEGELFSFEITEGDAGGATPEQIILERSAERMYQGVQAAFPEADFTLQIEAGEDCIPTGIRVFCDNREAGIAIARFVETNYKILTTFEEKEQV